MTDKNTTEYLEKLGTIRMSSDVKSHMRDELSSFADFHSVRIEEQSRSIERVQRNSVFAFFTHSKTQIMKASLLVALIIAGTGGTSFAAQGAIPGGFLYPIKLNVNENVRSAIAVDADAKAKLQATLLTERLEEAQKLAINGTLEGELKAEVRTNINTQLKKTRVASTDASAVVEVAVRKEVSNTLALFKSELASLQLNSSDELALATYSTEVSAHSNVQAGASAQMDSSIAMSADAPATMSMKAGGDAYYESEVSIEALILNAQAHIDGLSKVLKNTVELSAEVKTSMEVDVKLAVRYIADAETSLRAGVEDEAKVHVQLALEVIGTIESTLSALGEVEIDPETGSIINFNLGADSSTGMGTSGSEGSGLYPSVEPIIDNVTSGYYEGDAIDLPMELDSSAEASSFGF